jgi:hypothetical protein
MAAMVATERHQWVNLASIRETEKGFLPDALVSPSEQLDTRIEVVVDKCKETKARVGSL